MGHGMGAGQVIDKNVTPMRTPSGDETLDSINIIFTDDLPRRVVANNRRRKLQD